MSLLDLWNLFRKYFVRIAGMTIIGAALAVAFMLLFVDRKYESERAIISKSKIAATTDSHAIWRVTIECLLN